MSSSYVIDKLNAMKAELMSRGWGKTKLENDNGNICLLGARNIVVHGYSLQEEVEDQLDGYSSDVITDALVEVLTEESSHWKEYMEETACSSSSVVYGFNDSALTEFNDVVELIDKAIIKQKDNL